MMRKFIVPLVILLLILGGFVGWRLSHPASTDEQQIEASIAGICSQANARSPRGIADYLAKDFKAGGVGKSEFQNSLVGGILQYRVVDLSTPGTQTTVSGDKAQSSGNYVLSLKSEYNSPAEVQRGQFKLQWRRIDGEWLIVSAEADNPLLR